MLRASDSYGESSRRGRATGSEILGDESRHLFLCLGRVNTFELVGGYMWIPGKVARAISSTIITLVLKSPASREKHETSSRMKQEKRGFEAHPRTHRAVRELTAARRRKNRKWKRKKKCCGIQCSKIVETGKVVNVAKSQGLSHPVLEAPSRIRRSHPLWSISR